MNKDEILARYRCENSEQDEMEFQVELGAGRISKSVGFLLCILLNSLAYIAMGSRNVVSYACWTIFTGMNCVEYFVKAIKLKRKVVWIETVFWALCFVAFIVFFILELCI